MCKIKKPLNGFFFGALLLLSAVYFYCCYWPRRRWKNMKTFDRKQETDKAFLRCCPRSPCLFRRPCSCLRLFLHRLVSFALGALALFFNGLLRSPAAQRTYCARFISQLPRYGETTRNGKSQIYRHSFRTFLHYFIKLPNK